jgi:hypothetical protein
VTEMGGGDDICHSKTHGLRRINMAHDDKSGQAVKIKFLMIIL